MKLPEPSDLGLLIVRTDYSDDAAWHSALEAAAHVYERPDFPRGGVLLTSAESAELSGLSPQQVTAVPRDGYLMCLSVADSQTMKDRTLLFIDVDEVSEQMGRTFRTIPEEVEPIVANLSLANMDFHEFADSVDSDGVFRGFH